MALLKIPFKIKGGLLFAASLCFVHCQNQELKTIPDAEPAVEIEAPANALFQTTNSAETGVVFSNNLQENWRDNFLVNAYLYNGGGVAIADFDNDGLEDVFFTSTQGACKLFHQKSEWKFEDISAKAGVTAEQGVKSGVTVVDINNDGFKDLYVCRTNREPSDLRQNLLFINNGDLTFTEKAAQYGINDASASSIGNFFDYDLDGDLDLYLLNYPTDFRSVTRPTVKLVNGKHRADMAPKTPYDTDRMYRNDGGKFTDVTEAAGILNRGWGLSATVSDFNSDGYPDIFVGNDYYVPDYLYINQRNGTFKEESEQYFKHTSDHTMGVDIADFNNDEQPDLIALDMLAEDNRRQKKLMSTMMLDRYSSLEKLGLGHRLMRNTLQLNTGRGFSEIGVMSGVSNTDWSWAALFADFDLDGWKDLFVTNGYRRDVSDMDYVNFTSDSLNALGSLNKVFPSFDDFSKLIPSEKLQNYVYKNQGDLTFENASTRWGLTQKTFSNGAAYGDLDNDGDLDLIINNMDEEALVYRNTASEQGRGNFLKVMLEGSKSNIGAVGARARLTFTDGSSQYLEMTPTRGFLSSVSPVLHFGFPKNKTPQLLEVEFPGKKTASISSPKVNQKIGVKISQAKNGTLSKKTAAINKIFQASDLPGINFRHVENDFVDFHKEGLIPHKLSNLGPRITVGDINEDGLQDFFVGSAANARAAAFIQLSGGKFKPTNIPVWEADKAFEDMDALFFDADGDGDQDLYVVSGGNAHNDGFGLYQDRLYMNTKGNFAKAENSLPNTTTSGSCVAANDYDSDGDLDLFVGGRMKSGSYPLTPTSYILQNDGSGKFTDVTATVCPEFKNFGMITDIEFADTDGLPGEELIIAGEWLPISVFKNEGGKFSNKTSDLGLENSTGWWNCLRVSDLDGDGDRDLIAGNFGLNSRLDATATHPIKMYAKDFDNNSQVDPVIAWYQDGKYYPLPTRDAMVKQLAYLRKKFVKYAKYSTATIDDVFTKKELEDALQLNAKTLSSSVFINTGTGFSVKELPVEAQVTPVNGIVVDDFDEDGKNDLLLVGNNYGIQVETGRMDAGTGMVLFGDGSGNFSFVRSSESGFWADGDCRDLVPISIAGKKHFLIANNNAALTSFSLK